MGWPSLLSSTALVFERDLARRSNGNLKTGLTFSAISFASGLVLTFYIYCNTVT